MGRGLGCCLLGRPALDCRASLGVCGGHQIDLCMRENKFKSRDGVTDLPTYRCYRFGW